MGTLMENLQLPIDVIASFNTLEEIRPLYFRVENQEHERITLQIEDVLTHKEMKLAGIRVIKYYCRAHMEGELRYCELVYHIDKHVWKLQSIE